MVSRKPAMVSSPTQPARQPQPLRVTAILGLGCIFRGLLTGVVVLGESDCLLGAHAWNDVILGRWIDCC